MTLPPPPSVPYSPPIEEIVADSLADSLLNAHTYSIDHLAEGGDKLDQNESPYDWSPSLKQKVCEALMQSSWNLYPCPYPVELEKKLAHYLNIKPDQVLLGSGGTRMIELLFTCLQKRWVVARPSFTMYEQFCKVLSLPFTPWPLDQHFNYCPTLLPPLDKDSAVILASPNNPTGCVIAKDVLKQLLKTHPQVFFVVDAAYGQFSSESYLSLLDSYPNLILVGTFSKTLATAGIRVGYLASTPALITQLRKALPPFGMNHLSITALETLFNDSWAMRMCDKSVQKIVLQRERLYKAIKVYRGRKGFSCPPSHGNFLLLLWSNADHAHAMYEGLKKRRILLRNFSNKCGFAHGALRLTVGKEEQNTRFLNAFSEIFATL